MNKYPLNKSQKQNEVNIIQQIASENGYKTVKPPKAKGSSDDTAENTDIYRKNAQYSYTQATKRDT
jgi:hypothetical protein